MTLKTPQRWLILAHAFNMDGRAASQTITDKLPHLRAAGIELVVLSGVSGLHEREIEHHQLWPAGPAGLRFELRHVLGRRFGKGLRYRLLMFLASLMLLPWMFIEKLLRPIESSWSWWLSAYLKGRALWREREFDLIYSTGGAFAAHVAGHALKRATGIPWLAEVHDPMVEPGHTPDTPQQKMQAKVERLICDDADVAIWFTEQALASARARHPQLGQRGHMMLPGIDAPFTEFPAYEPHENFVIGHFGSLSPTRHLGPVLAALELMARELPAEQMARVELHVYGGPLDVVSEQRLSASPVRQTVRHFGRLEADPVSGLSGREQVLRRMRNATVLLLLHGEDDICAEYIPSKLYEYLWMQRPIVAVVHRNPQMGMIIREQGHAVIESQSQPPNAAQVAENLGRVLLGDFDRWSRSALNETSQASPFTTASAVRHLIGWVGALQKAGAATVKASDPSR